MPFCQGLCVCVCIICTHSVKPPAYFAFFFFLSLTPAKKYDNGEYLNITSITRDQAGDYECSALNDIASPDTKTVKVTVNCEYVYFISPVYYAVFSAHMKGLTSDGNTTTKPLEVFFGFLFFFF